MADALSVALVIVAKDEATAVIEKVQEQLNALSRGYKKVADEIKVFANVEKEVVTSLQESISAIEKTVAVEKQNVAGKEQLIAVEKELIAVEEKQSAVLNKLTDSLLPARQAMTQMATTGDLMTNQFKAMGSMIQEARMGFVQFSESATAAAGKLTDIILPVRQVTASMLKTGDLMTNQFKALGSMTQEARMSFVQFSEAATAAAGKLTDSLLPVRQVMASMLKTNDLMTNQFQALGSMTQEARMGFVQFSEAATAAAGQATAAVEELSAARNLYTGDLMTSTGAYGAASGSAEVLYKQELELRNAFVESGAAARAYSVDLGSLSTATVKESTVQKEAAAASKTNFSTITTFAKSVGLALGFIGYEGIKSAFDFQSATATIAARTDQTVADAGKITQAFLTTSGTTKYSGKEIADAFAPVSGEFQNLTSGAITASQALEYMDGATTLATASGAKLGPTTKLVADAMTRFNAAQKASTGKELTGQNVADTVFNTTRLLGTSVDEYGKALTRIEPFISGSNMTLGQTSALFVDLRQTAGTGTQAMRLAGKGMQDLISPTKSANTALLESGVRLRDSKGNFVGIVSAIDQMHNALARIPQTSQSMVSAQKMYNLEQDLATMKGEAQTKGLKKQESAISSQITSLKGLAGQLSQSSLMQAVFGKDAGMYAQIIAEGGPKYASLVKQIEATGSAHRAAEEKLKTANESFEKLKASVSNLSVAIGTALMPIITTLIDFITPIVAGIANWLQANKALTEVIAAFVGVITSAIVVVKTINAVSKLAKETKMAWGTVEKFFNEYISVQNGLLEASTGKLILNSAATEASTASTIGTNEAIKETNVLLPLMTEEAETTGLAMDAAFGPIGIVIGGLALAVGGLAYLFSGRGSSSAYDYASALKSVKDNAQAASDTLTSLAGDQVSVASDKLQLAADKVYAASHPQDEQAGLQVVRDKLSLLQDQGRILKDSASAAQSIQKLMGDAANASFSERFGQMSPGEAANIESDALKQVYDNLSTVAEALKAGHVSTANQFADALQRIQGLSVDNQIKALTNLPSNSAQWLTYLDQFLAKIKQISGDHPVNFTSHVTGQAPIGLVQSYASIPSYHPGADGGMRSGIASPASIPHLAKGGLVSSPTFALIGEAGPELILPLNGTPGGVSSLNQSNIMSSGIGGGGGGPVVNVTVNMQGAMYGNINQFANELGRVLATKIMPNSGTPLITT